MIFDDATRAQIEAARPDASTWLGANAGSGKTRVLTDRVARLLLDGVEPQHILCLTYTKAAASEMQNRLFKRLGAWAMLDDGPLSEAMAELGVEGRLTAAQLRKARTLFALAIETPGGLKIQTIHSFCAALLRRFPLEAQVSPEFTEIEDRAAELLRAEIVDQMAEGPDQARVADIARFYSGEDFASLTAQIVTMREAFGSPLSLGDALAVLDQPRDLSRDGILDAVFLGDEPELLEKLVPEFLVSSTNDARVGRQLQAITAFDWDALASLEKIFVYGPDTKQPLTAKIDRLPTKSLKEALGSRLVPFQALMLRVEDALPKRLALMAAEKTVALHDFAQAFLARYEAAKQMRGWLDFDDLILKARALLRDKQVAAWVLYRIDGGIDHILVDEAQDTSPRQWDVIQTLADEFYSGAGARSDTPRTLFVVGDEKQSIYSFQGADPLEFDRKRQSFESKFTAAGSFFQERSLDFSFRSSSAVLRLVDTVFDHRRRPAFAKQTEHIPFKSTLPGRVDLWPVVERSESPDDVEWTDPLDRRSAKHHTVILAEQIAAKIKNLTDPKNPSFIPDENPDDGTLIRRPIRPGDFLILVQRRSALFSEIIRACKAAGLPIAGADRLKVGAELAVKDLAALLSFLTSADDSLSLATALKSPLFGWDEQALFDLAHRRSERHLWQALRQRSDHHPETLAMLQDLREQIDFLRPYDLIERILTRHDGRRKLLARLGPEAEDGINAMLTQALAYERNDVPSLTGFIEWMQTDDLEIKRQIDSASNQIRVMTVHGSKGLEAPIVILPDTGRRDIVIRDEIIRVEGHPFWKPAADEMPAKLRSAVDEMKAAQQAERLRLLYVAMTRAEKWLMVAAAGDLSKDKSDWYQIIEEGMDQINAMEVDDSGVRRVEEGDWHGLSTESHVTNDAEFPILEPIFLERPPIFSYPTEVLSPSDLGGAKALSGELGAESDAAKSFGALVHMLLEHLAKLPKEEVDEKAQFLTAGLDPETAAQAIAEAQSVLHAPHLQHIFTPDALIEVPLTAKTGDTRLHGILDRLLVSETDVHLIDYKTNRAVPTSAEDCPEGVLRQMGAYAAMLQQVYPQHRIDVSILWTAHATLMPLPQDLVCAALWRSPYLDAAQGRS